jgi:rhodanese-related sulfurtransferase
MLRSALLSLLALAFAGAVPAGAQAPQAEAPRISVDEAREALAKGTAVLVDVRGVDAYKAEHAKGALSIPLNEVSGRAGELPKDKLIITYCT